MYSIRYYPRLHVTAVGLGMYYLQIRGSAPILLIKPIAVNWKW